MYTKQDIFGTALTYLLNQGRSGGYINYDGKRDCIGIFMKDPQPPQKGGKWARKISRWSWTDLDGVFKDEIPECEWEFWQGLQDLNDWDYHWDKRKLSKSGFKFIQNFCTRWKLKNPLEDAATRN